MNINQHNYEEFFLLYADGELSAQDKLAVDRFVQANPGLAEELDIFLQLKLSPEEIVFEEKILLYKNGAIGINLDNYETYFLLYVDNELGVAGKTAVETFVLQHPSLQEAFMLLKQTKLPAETMVFTGKASLYRREEKERKVFYMRWQTIAVAAAFTGLAVLVWTLFPSNSLQEGPITAQVPVVIKPSTTDQNKTAQPPATDHIDNPITAQTEPTNRSATVTAAISKQATTPSTDNTGQLTETADRTTEPQKELTAKLEQGTTIATGDPVRSDYVPEQPHMAAGVNKNLVQAKADAPVENTIAQPAVYRDLDTDTDDEKKSLYVGSLEINKDKLRGFFRKAGSLFRGKAKQQEEDRTEGTPSNTRSLK